MTGRSGESNPLFEVRPSSGTDVPAALINAFTTSVAGVERDRIASDERITLAALSNDLEEQRLVFELEKERMANEHVRDRWAARFVTVGILIESLLIIGAVVLHVTGNVAIANLLLGTGLGGLGGAGMVGWHAAERDRRERQRASTRSLHAQISRVGSAGSSDEGTLLG